MSGNGLRFALAMWLFSSRAAFLVLLCITAANATTLARAGTGSRLGQTSFRLVPKFYNTHHCEGKTHSLIIKNVSTKLDKYGAEFADADWELTTPAQKLTAMRIILHRCPLGVSSQWEYYNTFAYNMPLCNLIHAENRVWTPMAETMRPQLNCPVRKGSYTNRNATANFDAVEKMMRAGLNVDRFSWRTEIQVDSEKGLYACFKFVGELKRIRKRE